MSESVSATPSANAARAYLVLFPLAHGIPVPVGGAMGTGADVLGVALLTVWMGDVLARRSGRARLGAAMAGRPVPGMPSRSYLAGLAVLAGFGIWVGLSGAWGFHPLYAAAKGAGTLSLVLVALAVATSGLGWRGAADAWLVGTGVALLATATLWATGPAGGRDAVVYLGGGVQGLPFPRISGPFLHPNMFGDYLVVSAFLLLGRGPEWTGRARRAVVALAAGLGAALLMTASTALIGAGLVAVWLGTSLATRAHRLRGTGLVLGGAAMAGAAAAFVFLPMHVRLFGLELVGSGMRPEIWRTSVQAILQSPLVGVGAAPFLGQAVDPLREGAVGLWDAHNAYLSVLGQFGLVGGVLLALGVGLVLRGAGAGKGGTGAIGPRGRRALGLAAVAVAVNALFLASEDLRHLWVLMGVSADLSVGAE